MIKYKSYSTTSSNATRSGILYDIGVIKEDILSLVLTRKGDYPQDLDKGCIVHDYLFDPVLNSDEEAEIKEDFITQLSSDPRLSNIRVFLSNIEEDLIIAIYADIVGIDEELMMTVTLKE